MFIISMSVFGQDALQQDLNKSLKRFEIIKLDNKAVLDKAKSRQPIKLQAYGRNFEFVLTPNDLRAANYKAVESTVYGEREMEPGEVSTYKGKLSDDADSEVRFTITKGKIEGLIYTGDTKFFVNQAAEFSNKAQTNEVVVYTENDLLKTVDLSDDAGTLNNDFSGKLNFGLDVLKSYLYGTPQTAEAYTTEAATDVKQVEVATEADYQWVTQSGGASAANSEILSILNLVDGIYRRDLNLTVKVTFQHAWSTSDPYAGSSTQTVLDSFLNYWNANYSQSQYPRDTAHLFTGKYSNQGIAYQGIVCRSSNYAYGLTARSGTVNHLITAHEMGHNLGAEHVDNSGTCANSMMNPIISQSVSSFCDVSKSQIASYVANNGSCLSSTGVVPTPTPILTPTPTPTPRITPTPTPIFTPTPTPTPFVTPTPLITPTPFVTPTPTSGRTNVALAVNGGVASASSQLSSASAAIDGIRNWATSGSWKDTTQFSYPDWLQVDFSSSKTINEIDVYAVRDDYTNTADPTENTTTSIYGITNFDVQYWTGSNWVTVPNGSISGNNKALVRITFTSITTSRIRVVVNSGQDGFSRVVELEAWSGGGSNVSLAKSDSKETELDNNLFKGAMASVLFLLRNQFLG